MILHLMVAEKFTQPFIDYVEKKFPEQDHCYFVYNRKNKLQLSPNKRLIVVPKINLKVLVQLGQLIRDARRVMIHGLFRKEMILVLALNKKFLGKCYWFLWGGDLYNYFSRNRSLSSRFWELLRRRVIKNIGNIVTYVKDDYQMACQFYQTGAQLHECLLYPSNVCASTALSISRNTKTKILLGNSASKTNHHEQVMTELLKYRNSIELIVPLSYGNVEYAAQIRQIGVKSFGTDFHSLDKILPFSQYIEVLQTIDVAVFNHSRQQGMGNSIQLLAMGKKVFLNPKTPQWRLFSDLGIKVFSVEQLDLSPLPESEAVANREKVLAYFSDENLQHQLNSLFT